MWIPRSGAFEALYVFSLIGSGRLDRTTADSEQYVGALGGSKNPAIIGEAYPKWGSRLQPTYLPIGGICCGPSLKGSVIRDVHAPN